MGRFVNPDNAAFQVALNSKIYVDKTKLIEYTNSILDTVDAYICNSRPRRFGKSYTANMLSAYYSKGCDSEKMFAELEISKTSSYKEHLNKYDVIHMDIQWFWSNCEEKKRVVQFITNSVLRELRDTYSSVLTEEVVFLSDALSRIREKTGQKFIIIIDEWDVLIRDETANKNVQEEYLNFLRGMFKGTEPTKYIQLAYLTGILPIKREKTQSALNNFNEYTMLSAGKLSPYIGFTEDEVIVPLINMAFDGLKTAIIEMLSGASVKINTSMFQNDAVHFKSRDDVLTYLIHLGYLGYDRRTESAFVPNEEIRKELSNAVISTKWNEFFHFQQESCTGSRAKMESKC